MDAKNSTGRPVYLWVFSSHEDCFRAPLLTLRLLTLIVLVALLTIHLRSLRVFRWELSVSGGLLVAYCVASLGLALCAGSQNCGGKVLQVTIL